MYVHSYLWPVSCPTMWITHLYIHVQTHFQFACFVRHLNSFEIPGTQSSGGSVGGVQPLNLKAVDSNPVQDRSSFLKHCLTESNGHGFESHPRLLQLFFSQALSSLYKVVVEVHGLYTYFAGSTVICVRVNVSGCIYIHTHIYTHTHILYIYMYIHTHIYTHTHILYI